MNDFIVTISYFPKIWGKDKTFRVKTGMSKRNLYNKIRGEELKKNEGFDISVAVETIDEYLKDFEVKEM